MIIEVFVILVFIAVVAAAAVLFCVWVVAELCRAVVRTTGRVFSPRRAAAPQRGPQACGNVDCRGDNPPHARFCRRCGRPLPALMRLVDARAA